LAQFVVFLDPLIPFDQRTPNTSSPVCVISADATHRRSIIRSSHIALIAQERVIATGRPIILGVSTDSATFNRCSVQGAFIDRRE